MDNVAPWTMVRMNEVGRDGEIRQVKLYSGVEDGDGGRLRIGIYRPIATDTECQFTLIQQVELSGFTAGLNQVRHFY